MPVQQTLSNAERIQRLEMTLGTLIHWLFGTLDQQSCKALLTMLEDEPSAENSPEQRIWPDQSKLNALVLRRDVMRLVQE